MILILKAFDVSFSILRASPEFWHDVFRPNRCWGWLDLPCCLAEVGTCFKASRCNWLELVYQADHISSIHLDWIGWRGSERWFQPVFMKGRTVLFGNLLKRERPKLNKHPSPKDLKSLQDQLTTWVPGESLYVKNRAFVTERLRLLQSKNYTWKNTATKSATDSQAWKSAAIREDMGKHKNLHHFCVHRTS